VTKGKKIRIVLSMLLLSFGIILGIYMIIFVDLRGTSTRLWHKLSEEGEIIVKAVMAVATIGNIYSVYKGINILIKSDDNDDPGM
jgi:hypothetical protein